VVTKIAESNGVYFMNMDVVFLHENICLHWYFTLSSCSQLLNSCFTKGALCKVASVISQAKSKHTIHTHTRQHFWACFVSLPSLLSPSRMIHLQKKFVLLARNCLH